MYMAIYGCFRLVLYSDVLHLHDSSLQLQHIWRWTEPGASVTLPEPSVPSARATVLLSQETSSGTRVGWLDLCDKGQWLGGEIEKRPDRWLASVQTCSVWMCFWGDDGDG